MVSTLKINGRRLEFFFEVASAGSIRRAAERLGVEPSVVTRQIQQLETDLESELFDRKGRGIVPNQAAEIVMDYYRERTSMDDALRTQLNELKGLERGHVSIACAEGYIESFMLTVLNDFCNAHPKLTLNLETGTATDIVRRVARDEADIGITFSSKPESTVTILKERLQPICMVMGAHHPLAASKAPPMLKDVLDYPVALATRGSGLRKLLDMAEYAENIQLRPSFTTNSVVALRQFVLTNAGVTFLSGEAAALLPSQELLVARRTGNAVLESATAHLLVRSGRRYSAGMQALLTAIHATRFFG